jgi:hypothetical protein
MAWAAATSVSKLDILEQLEVWFSASDPDQLRQRYDEAIDSLDDPEPPRWLSVAQQAGLDDETEAHFRAHWLGEGKHPYWTSMVREDTVTKIRSGFKDAMTTARDLGLPMSYVWVTPPGLPHDYFEVSHVAGPHTVVAVIVTTAPNLRGD